MKRYLPESGYRSYPTRLGGETPGRRPDIVTRHGIDLQRPVQRKGSLHKNISVSGCHIRDVIVTERAWNGEVKGAKARD